MGTPGDTPIVKPIVAILAASMELLEDARDVLNDRFAPIDMVSEVVRWKVSDYYRGEMGDEIWRQFVSLHNLEPADEIVTQKLGTNDLEDCWRTSRGRQVNLDPGFIDLNRLVLASTKDAAHRIYVGQGVYAEATLRFVRGSFEPWPYTYPDYAATAALEFFKRVRERFREQVSSQKDRASG